MSCNCAFLDYISNCNDAIKVNALLIPARPYTWVVTDKFGKEYSGESISDGEGFISIAVTSLPDGFLTEFSGEFKLEIYEDVCRKAEFKMAKMYDSIRFTVGGGTRIKDNLGCDFTCDTGGSSAPNSAVFPFDAAANITIPWTNFLKSLYGGTPTVQVYQEISPGVYQLANVAVTMVGGPYDLNEIDIDNGGPASGYVLIN
jgi:hypothetical protein